MSEALADWRSIDGSRTLAAALAERGVDDERPTVAYRVPGRVELLGKHTDYAGGMSLTGAIEPAITLLVAPRADRTLRWVDVGGGVEASFELTTVGARAGHWSNYLRTVAMRLQADTGGLPHGADVAMTSTLPRAAGLSSSSALVVSALLALDAASGVRRRLPWGDDRLRLAEYLGAIESGRDFDGSAAGVGVGTDGGCQDHAAILGSRQGRLRLLRFGPLRHRRWLPWPAGRRLAIAVSGVEARKSGAARPLYNRLAAEASALAAAWRRATGSEAPHLAALLAEAGGVDSALAKLAPQLDSAEVADRLEARLRGFAVESGELVPRAAAALAERDFGTFGDVSASSTQLAETLLGNQVPETVTLVRLARELGAIAASPFGAGFGGAVWAMVDAVEAEPWLALWRTRYERLFPDRVGRFLLTDLVGGAARWQPEEMRCA